MQSPQLFFIFLLCFIIGNNQEWISPKIERYCLYPQLRPLFSSQVPAISYQLLSLQLLDESVEPLQHLVTQGVRPIVTLGQEFNFS